MFGSGILCMYKHFHWGMRRENIKSFSDGMGIFWNYKKASKYEWGIKSEELVPREKIISIF